MNQNPFKSVSSVVKTDLSRRSVLAKADPYSNKTHRRIDIALVVITLVLIFLAFRLSAHDRAISSTSVQTKTSQSNH